MRITSNLQEKLYTCCCCTSKHTLEQSSKKDKQSNWRYNLLNAMARTGGSHWRCRFTCQHKINRGHYFSDSLTLQTWIWDLKRIFRASMSIRICTLVKSASRYVGREISHQRLTPQALLLNIMNKKTKKYQNYCASCNAWSEWHTRLYPDWKLCYARKSLHIREQCAS